MKDYIEERAIKIASYIIENNATVRQTAKANGLNIFTYLEYLLLYMPDTDWRNHPEDLDALMPWSEAVQAECKG